MNKTSIKRAFLFSIQNIWRDKILSLSTLVVITLIIFIFNIILVINFLTNSGIDQLNKKVDIVLYLKDDIDYLIIPSIINDIQKYPEVKKVEYKSKDDALKQILEKYEGQDQQNPFEEYGIANPLPSSITIITYEPRNQKNLLDKIESGDLNKYFKASQNNDDNADIVEKLISITSFTENLLITIIITFAFGSVMIIMNALHLTIQNRKNEILIQKLVGSDISFIRLPYIFEGLIYGVLSSIFSGILIFIFFEKTNLFEISILNYSVNFYNIILGQFISCISISLLASFLAIQRYIKHVSL